MTTKTLIKSIIIISIVAFIAILYINCHGQMSQLSYRLPELDEVYGKDFINIERAAFVPPMEEEAEIIIETEVVEPEPHPVEKNYFAMINPEDVKVLGNVVYGEARGLCDMEKAAVVWCILNRLDNGHYGKTIADIVTAKGQFTGYNANRVYKTEEAKKLLTHCEELAADVLIRYYQEKDGVENVGRTLPKEYLYFTGDGKHNNYKKEWKKSAPIFTWTLENPYDI